MIDVRWRNHPCVPSSSISWKPCGPIPDVCRTQARYARLCWQKCHITLHNKSSTQNQRPSCRWTLKAISAVDLSRTFSLPSQHACAFQPWSDGTPRQQSGIPEFDPNLRLSRQRCVQRTALVSQDQSALVSLQLPQEKVNLAMLPTPIHPWHLPGLPDGVGAYIKRDDMSGMQMSGNKVRKLEFLMAEALQGGHDCVITIGGIQSNHCRATSTAAKYLGLDCHLILRNTEHFAKQDPGLVGNLLVERLQGAHVHQVSKAEYVHTGSEALCAQLADRLRSEGKNPYVIPVGGSNALGCWGYMMAMQEIAQLSEDMGIRFTDIVMACGSGATTAGLAVANHLCGYGARVHGYAVCDDETYFYDFMDNLIGGLGLPAPVSSRELVHMVQCKGAGYAISRVCQRQSQRSALVFCAHLADVDKRRRKYTRDDELKTMLDVSMATGVVLDPVYSGKAVHGLLQSMAASPSQWRNRNVLFVHTGGLLGMYDKIAQMQPMVESLGRAERMNVQG